MNRLALTLAIMLVLQHLSFAESWEEFQKNAAVDEQEILVPKGGPKIIPKDLVLEGLKKNCQVTFTSEALLFQYGSDTIKKESLPTIRNTAAAIRQAMEDPELTRIQTYYVDGHTCNIGSASNNCRLSRMRAEAVIAELVKWGVPKEKLVARGYGLAYPAYPNDSEASRMLNRRVVLKGDCPDATARDSQIPCFVQRSFAGGDLSRRNNPQELKAKAFPLHFIQVE
ncbi:MAG TPA: OmpA family protein [Desulfomonilaceae bacterium]|nr:OmpA family protein [Desulfomonilaceae bacterium]